MRDEHEAVEGEEIAETLSIEDLTDTLPIKELASTVPLEDISDPSASVAAERIEKLAAQSNTHRRYEVTGEAGRGGMGAVLQVFDADLRRTLAMKVILARANGTDGPPEVAPAVLARFLEEAQVTGQLDHPGVVPVHELGVDEQGRAYFTMPLVKGRELKEVIDQVHSNESDWSLTRALGAMLKVCEAMSYAHDKGVVHRDLKPANVMVGDYGEVYVMDWGLARVLGHEDHHDLRLKPNAQSTPAPVRTDRKDAASTAPTSVLVTMDGAVMGTPCYMAPEQAHGRIDEIGPASDVYAVGAMLYHLLTGRMPYVDPKQKTTPQQVLELARKEPPRPVQQLAQKVPAELVSICEHAMERDPKQRYADMGALATDLRAFLENRVVQAHRTGPMAELNKWVQRNKALAVTGFLSAIVIVSGSVASSVIFRDQRDRAITAETDASLQRDFADKARGEAERERDNARERLVNAHSQTGTRTRASGDSTGASLWFAKALESSKGFAELAELQRRRLAWDLSGAPEFVFTAQGEEATSEAHLSPDGNRLLTTHGEHGCHLWDLESGRELAFFPGARGYFSEDGERIALLAVVQTYDEEDNLIYRTRISSADGRTGKRLAEPVEIPGWTTWHGFVESGESFFIERHVPDTAINAIVLWSMTDNAPVSEGKLLITGSTDFQRTPDGELAVALGSAYGRGGELIVFHPHEGEVRHRIADSTVGNHLVLADDGRTVATGSGSQVRVWNTATGKPFSPVLEHGEDIEHLRYAAETGIVVTVSTHYELTEEGWDRNRFKVRIWDVTPGADPAPLEFEQDDLLREVALMPNGERVVTITGHPQDDEDEVPHTFFLTQEWNARTGEKTNEGHIRTGGLGEIGSPVFLSDGRFLTSAPAKSSTAADKESAVTLWDPAQPGFAPTSYSLGGDCVAEDFDVNVQRAVIIPVVDTTVDTERVVSASVLDLRTATPPLSLAVDPETEVFGFALRPDGKHIATAGDDHAVRVFDTVTGLPALPPLAFDGNVFRVVYSPDGTKIFAGGRDNTARLFDADTGQQLVPPIEHPEAVDEVGFSRDGAIAWTRSRDGSARLIDSSTGEVMGRFGGSQDNSGLLLFDSSVKDVVIHPAGKRVLVIRGDGDASCLVDIEEERYIVRGFDTYGDLRAGAFNADGSLVATAGGSGIRGEVRAWDAETGEQSGRTMLHEAAVTSVEFSPDGRLIVSADWGGTARLWNARTGEPATPAMEHGKVIKRARFSPDGTLFVTACEDGTVRIWSTHSGELLLEPLVLLDEYDNKAVGVKDVLFGPESKRLFALPMDGDAAPRIWSIAPDGRSPELLTVMSELRSRRRVNEMGSLSDLSEEEIAERVSLLARIRAQTR